MAIVDPFAEKPSKGIVDPFATEKAPAPKQRTFGETVRQIPENIGKIFKSEYEQVKEAGRGAALPFLGLAQSVPYEPLQRAATKKVAEIEATPETMASPEGFGTPRELGKFITSAGLYGGPYSRLVQATRGLSLPARVGTRAAGGGAIGGAAAAAMEEAPTMEQIPERKGTAAQYGAGVSALLTPAIPGVGELIGAGRRLVQRARGRPLEASEETLRGTTEQVGKETTERVAEQQRVGAEKIYTQAQRREINLRDASKQFDEQAQRAKAESEKALRQIGPVSDDVALGEKIRQTAVLTEQGLREARQTAADKLKTTYFNEAKANEKAGNFWAQSETGKEFIKFLKDIQNPANAGRFTMDEIAAARDLELSLATRKVKGRAVPSEIDKIEKIIREAKEVQRMPVAEGAKALQQQYKSKLAQKLEDSVYGYVDEVGVLKEGFAPGGRVFRNVYREMSIPLNQYESPVGRVLTEQVEGLPGVFRADVTSIPSNVFKSPQQIAILDTAGISRGRLEPLAAEYTANRLSRFNSAEKINEFLNSAEGAYLREFPQLQAKVRDYANTFARNEKKVEQSLAGAKALEQRAGTIAERRQTAEQRLTADTAQNRAYIENSLANIRNAPTERLGAQAESYFKGLRERGLINTADEARYIAQVRDINDKIQDRAAARKSLINLGILAAGAVGINYAAGYLTNRFLGGL